MLFFSRTTAGSPFNKWMKRFCNSSLRAALALQQRLGQAAQMCMDRPVSPTRLNTGIGCVDNGTPWKSYAGMTAGILCLGNHAAVTQSNHKADSVAVRSGFLSGGERKSPFSLKIKPFQTMHISEHALYCDDTTSLESCSTETA